MKSQEETPLAEVRFKLAKAWQLKGKIDTAIAGYKEVLKLQPDHTQTSLNLGELLLEKGQLEAALTVYSQGIEFNPNDVKLQKNLINTFTQKNGLDATFKLYELNRIDQKELEVQPDDILCCTVVRNELLRLAYFLTYHREKGINKFFIVDNNSTDDTQSYLLSQPDVYLWNSHLSFNQANFGSAWFELLLRKYGIDHWCLIVDADELLYYPNCETKSIHQLCQQLDRKHKKAFNTVLLDMYSDQLIKESFYTQGQNFLEVCPYFDQKFYHIKYEQAGIYGNQTVYFGGVRERVFGKKGDYYLSKVPLIKYSLERVLAGGQHFTNCSQAEIALETGCLLHFKYFSSFLSYVQGEVTRKEHYGGGMQYAEYAKSLTENQDLSLYDPKDSIKLQNSQQLVELGIMQTEEIQPEFPEIYPVVVNIHRPFWSVMITVYNRLQHLEKALKSVIEQADSPEQMQIEVINDGAENSIQDDIEAIVQSVGGDRISFYKHPENVGHPHIFNLCIQRSHGEWIHILHDDDWLEPDFYSCLRSGIEKAPIIGAAFCRQIYTDNSGNPRHSPLEQQTSGILENWVEKISLWCRVQFSSMVVRRDVYEQLGGFCPQAKSAFDWEMWKRIAVNYPVWYEPQTKVCFNKDATTETSQLLKTGGQIADTRQAIEISRQYLPGGIADQLSYKALQYYAEYTLHLAQQQLNRLEYKEAIANILEGLKCSPTPAVESALISLYRQQENR